MNVIIIDNDDETKERLKEKDVNDFKNWTEIIKGLYRYVLGANCAYEIQILHWDCNTDILTAKASLFIVGYWRQSNGNSFFERECLLSGHPIFECIDFAIKDNKENNK